MGVVLRGSWSLAPFQPSMPSSDKVAGRWERRLGSWEPLLWTCPPASPQEILHIFHRDIPCCVQRGVSTGGRVNRHG